MARALLVTEQVERDLEEIHDYIAHDKPQAARRVIQKLRRKFETLATFPELGAIYDELEPGLRRYPAGTYVIFYKDVPDGIQVVRVAHGARS